MATGRRILVGLTLLGLVAGVARSGEDGRIEGRLTARDGRTLAGVSVRIDQPVRKSFTDPDGRFVLRHVPAGSHVITCELGREAEEIPVVVEAGRTTVIDRRLEWEPRFRETVVVTGASRRPENLMNAPAAVSRVDHEESARRAAAGLPARVLDSQPGVEMAQSGNDWYIVNARGFASGLNRRVAVLLDGRDLSTPFLRIPEWGAFVMPVDDLASVELVRGPGSALHGADAFNGVIEMRTRSPRDSLGGSYWLTVGGGDTYRADVRHAREIGEGWFLKVTASAAGSAPFSVSRTEDTEYARPCTSGETVGCLPLDAAPIPLDYGKSRGGLLRVDHYGTGDRHLVLEGGASGFESGTAFFSGLGRFAAVDENRAWLRTRFEGSRWSAQAVYDSREGETLSLTAGTASFLDSSRLALDAQAWASVADGRGHLVGGVSYRRESIDTAGPDGRQTLMAEAVEPDFRAVFGEMDLSLRDGLDAYVSLRWDDGSLYDSQVSTRTSLLVRTGGQSTLRVGYADAFMAPNPGEQYLRIALAPPIDLSAFEAICAAEDVSCGFDTPVEFLGLGNPYLDVERVKTWELGWRAGLRGGVFLEVEVYHSRLEDFLTEPIPIWNPGLGSYHPDYPRYRPPEELSPESAALLLGALASALPADVFSALTTDASDSPLLALSYANYGRVDVTGAEVGAVWAPGTHWTVRARYGFFDDEVEDELPASPVAPNASRHRYGVDGTYRSEKLSISVGWRHVQAFCWRSGLTVGLVPTYDVVNAQVFVSVAPGWSAVLDVENLLDERHYEQFGADLLERRALVSLRRTW